MAYMGNGRHLETGSQEPSSPKKDVLRVYGMKFCPYVHRLKLVLAAKNIEHETININLARKPEWYFAKNPHGKVPCIEKNGEILYESDITSTYVDEVFPGRKLTTGCPLQKAKELLVLNHFNTAVQGYYGIAFAGDNEQARAAGRAKLEGGFKFLENYLKTTGYQYICKDQPGMTDYMVWPHLERIIISFVDDLEKYPAIVAYIERMGKDEPVIACRHGEALLTEFAQSYMNKNPTYDIGTVEEYSKL